MGNRLAGKVAIVTGAGSSPGEGIGNGKAAAVTYAREGAAVMLVDIRAEAAEETKKMIDREGGICSVFQGNVTDGKSCQAMAAECLKTYGHIDILHNNVGVSPRVFGGPPDIDESEWDRVMNTNLKSMVLTCRAIIPQMLIQKKGAILNISSIASVRSGYRQFVYGASKAGVNALTFHLAVEYADKGIRVNAIIPGLIDTPMVQPLKVLHGGDLERMRRERSERAPMKKMGEAWDIAYAALFLVSDEARYITGQALAVDGGLRYKG